MKVKAGTAVLVSILAVVLAGCGKAPESSAAGTTSQSWESSPAPGQEASTAQGAVQRDYPTAAEEAALKLNYPLFLAYGPDSARITPFFPGASKQPVAVKLAPDQAGYVLQAQGNVCAFPVAYQLKTGDGKQLASGDYSGTAALDLAGWNEQEGTAVLTLEMSSGAKNNFGCNVVIRKK